MVNFLDGWFSVDCHPWSFWTIVTSFSFVHPVSFHIILHQVHIFVDLAALGRSRFSFVRYEDFDHSMGSLALVAYCFRHQLTVFVDSLVLVSGCFLNVLVHTQNKDIVRRVLLNVIPFLRFIRTFSRTRRLLNSPT